MKKFINKYPFIVLVLGLALLLLTQQKIILPFVYEIAGSDLFLIESNDKSSQLPISTPLSELAFKNCNKYIESKLPTNSHATFSEKPLNAWSLGNYQYVINAEATIFDAASKSNTHKYACRITYKNGDDQQGINDINNWSIEGLSGIDH